MKAEIVVTFEGITQEQLWAAIQGLRNVEQTNPQLINMYMMVTASDLTEEQSVGLLKSINPPFTYFKQFTPASTFTANRNVGLWPKK